MGERHGRRAVRSQDASTLDEVELRVRAVERVVGDSGGERAGEAASRVAEAELAAPVRAGEEIARPRPAERILAVSDLVLRGVEVGDVEPCGVAVRESKRVRPERQRADVVRGRETTLRAPQALPPAANDQVSVLGPVPSPVGGVPTRASRHRQTLG